ncbi:MAG: hypothetical protein H6648_07845 [Caldilineae bacterium]|nr:hypothetical protein [Caldilineae bacterium]
MQHPSRFGNPAAGRLVCLGLTAILAACGGASPEASDPPATEAVIEAPTAEQPPTREATALPTEAATEPPTAEATEAAPLAPTALPATALPVTAAPTSPPAPSAAPTAETFVEFYPDNWTYQLDENQLCAGVNWRSSGVSDLVFGREGFGSEPVEAEGRKTDLCFPERDADFYLEYRLPDGQVERKTMHLERDK